jgi:hypothetical protein
MQSRSAPPYSTNCLARPGAAATSRIARRPGPARGASASSASANAPPLRNSAVFSPISCARARAWVPASPAPPAAWPALRARVARADSQAASSYRQSPCARRQLCTATPAARQAQWFARAYAAERRAACKVCSAAAVHASGASDRGRACQYAGAASFVRQPRHTVLRRHRSRVPARSAAARRAAAPTIEAPPRAAQRPHLPARMSGAGVR